MTKIESELKHETLLARPALNVDMDRIEAMWQMLMATAHQVNHNMAIKVIDGSRVTQIGQFATIMELPAGGPKFHGLAYCPHCLARAATGFRDLANTLDDLIAAVKPHGKPVSTK